MFSVVIGYPIQLGLLSLDAHAPRSTKTKNKMPTWLMKTSQDIKDSEIEAHGEKRASKYKVNFALATGLTEKDPPHLSMHRVFVSGIMD